MIKQSTGSSFADVMTSHRKINTAFFDRIDKLVDFDELSQAIRKYYHKGKSVDGRQSYDGLLLFKMLLLQNWFGLSDEQVEQQVNDRLSFNKFCGLSLEDTVPDATVLCRFRTALSNNNAFEKLLNMVNKQLGKHKVIVTQGLIVDASVTDTLQKPKGKKTYEIVEDRKEDDTESTKTLQPKIADSVDKEAAWLKKGNELHYGYKKHVCTNQDGYVLAIHTTAANESDIKNLASVLDKVEVTAQTPVNTDKGYQSEENRQYLQKRKLKCRIQHKATKNKPLSQRQTAINKAISKVRYTIERTFGSIRRWFKSDVARYKGKAKTHSQHLLEAICYNLYRQPIVG